MATITHPTDTLYTIVGEATTLYVMLRYSQEAEAHLWGVYDDEADEGTPYFATTDVTSALEYAEAIADDTCEDDERDPFRDDVEADADTLASAGWGTDEDYGCFGGDDC